MNISQILIGHKYRFDHCSKLEPIDIVVVDAINNASIKATGSDGIQGLVYPDELTCVELAIVEGAD